MVKRSTNAADTNTYALVRKLILAWLLALCTCVASLAFARPALAYQGVPDDIGSADWMSGLTDDVALSDLSIPGTHDSGTCWTVLGDPYSWCQLTTIGKHSYEYIPYDGDPQTITYDGMLNEGVRHLDLRIHKDDDGLAIYHGFSWNKCVLLDSQWYDGQGTWEILTLDHVMSWVEDFLRDHPGETIILEITNETDNPDTDCPAIFDYFHNLATQPNSIVWSGNHVPTLGEVRGKVVIFSRLGDVYKDQKDYDDGKGGYWALNVFWSGGDSTNKRAEYTFSGDDFEVWSQNTWSGISTSEKRDYVYNSLARQGAAETSFAEDTVADVASRGKKTWFVSYASANTSPGTTPRDYSLVVNPCISDQIAPEGSDVFCGLLAMDHVDKDLVEHVWATNYNRWGAPTYSWSDDYSECTATRAKLADPSDTESVSVRTTSKETKEPTCTQPGTMTYTASFANCTWAQDQTKDVDIPPLGHHWESDEPTGALRPTRHVWCSRGGCSYTKDKGFYLQIAMPSDAMYDGEPYPAQIVGRMTEEMEQLISVDYLDPSSKTPIAQEPVYAGRHTVRATLAGEQSVSFSGFFEIQKRPADVRAFDQVVEEGSEIGQGPQFACLASSADGHRPVADDRLSEVSLEPTGAVNVGGSITPSAARIASASGVDVTDSYDLSYEDGLLVVVDHGTPVFDLPRMKLDMVYDGTEQELATPGTAPYGYKMEYSLNYGTAANDADWSEEMPRGKDAGTYSLWYRVVRNDNSLSPVLVPPTQIPARIWQRSVELTWVDQYVYDGQPKVPTATVANLIEGDDVSVSVDANDTFGTDGDEVLAAIEAPRKVGIYNAKATGLTGSSAANYFISTRQMWHAYRIVPCPVSIDGHVAQDKTYDGTCDVVLDVSQATFPELVAGDELRLIECTGAFADADAGEGKSVLVTDVVLGGADVHEYRYDDGQPLLQTASIAQREVALAWDNTHFWYDGRSHVPTACATGLMMGDTCSVSVEGAQVEAGSYTARAVSLTNANYCLPADATCDFVIQIAEVDVPWQVVSEDGAPQMSSANLGAMANELATDAERGLYVQGEPLMITLSVRRLDQADVPAADAGPAQDLMSEQGLSAGMWLDITLSKETGAGTTAISKTTTPVQFSLEVPSSLRASGRSYALVRSHEGQAERVSKNDGIVLNTESSEFSTYVIAYGDGSPSPKPSPTPSPTPSTGDPTVGTLLIVLALLAIASFGFAHLAAKRH